jgi:hypothetical protein
MVKEKDVYLVQHLLEERRYSMKEISVMINAVLELRLKRNHN